MNTPAHLTDRVAHDLGNAVRLLELAVGTGIVPNTTFTLAKDRINRAVDTGTEAFLQTGPRMSERPHQSDWWHRAYEANAFASGATNVPTARKRAEKAGLTEYVAYLDTLKPLCDLLTAAKPLIKKRGELPVVKTAKQLADEADQMTCQCCGRGIFAATGTIAHHGYERPGHGYQTASCMGAKELPFEVDRAVLAKLIVALQRHAEGMKATRAEFAAEQHAIRRGWTTGRWDARQEHTFDFTRANFDEPLAREARRAIGIYGDFDDVLKAELAARDYAIRGIEQDIAAQQARYDGWKQTHRREGGKWVEV